MELSPVSPPPKDEEDVEDAQEPEDEYGDLHPEDVGHPKRDYLLYLNLVSHHKKNGKTILS